MDLKELKQSLLKDPEFKKEYYNKKDLAFEISEMVKKMRIKNGLTQKKLAKLIKTKQPSIARIENGTATLPTLNFLQKIAMALNTYLIPPRFASLEETETVKVEVDLYKFVKEEYRVDDSNIITKINELIKNSDTKKSLLKV